MSKLEIAKKIIKENFRIAYCGIYNTRNIVGDTMQTIYCKDGLVIDVCIFWCYFEVFGLDYADYCDLEEYYYSLRESE